MKKDNSVKGKDLDNTYRSMKVVGKIHLTVDLVDKLPKYLAITCYNVKSQFVSRVFFSCFFFGL